MGNLRDVAAHVAETAKELVDLAECLDGEGRVYGGIDQGNYLSTRGYTWVEVPRNCLSKIRRRFGKMKVDQKYAQGPDSYYAVIHCDGLSRLAIRYVGKMPKNGKCQIVEAERMNEAVEAQPAKTVKYYSLVCR